MEAPNNRVVLNGKVTIARGSTTPHMAEFVAAARKRYANAFLEDLRKVRAKRLMEILAVDPSERARIRAKGFSVPGD